MTGTVKTIDCAAALRITKKSLLERAEKEHWPCVRKGNALLWVENRLPLDVRFALQCGAPQTLPEKEPVDIRQDVYTNADDKKRETANWRSSLIFEYKNYGGNVQSFIEAYNHGDVNPLLLSKLGQLSVPTFYRWLKEFKADGASGVIPKYGINRGGAGESLSDIEKDLLRTFWLKDTQPSVSHALMLMKVNVPYSVCTYQTASRYLKQIPPVIADYYRKGKSRFENAHLPYMEQDIERYKSLDCVVSDHHCLDCVCMYHGQLMRPWITTMQDYRSGKVLGWCVCAKPSSLSIIVAYYMTVIRYGIPLGLLFDNGKDYHSKLLQGHNEAIKVLTPEGITEEQEVYFNGVFTNIGSTVNFTRVYNGKSKGRQERYFRVIGEYLAKDFGTYVGSDSRSRPEEAQLMWRGINGMEQRHDIPDWQEFVKSANCMVEYINDKMPCTGKGMNGKTRSEVFDMYLPSDVRHATKEMLQAALVTGDIRRCGRNGVKIGGTNYWSPDLAMYSGQDVIVRTSLVIDNEVQIYDPHGKFVCTAYGDYFKESGDFKTDIARLEGARKRSLALIAEQGTNEVQPAPEYRSMVAAAEHMYGDASLPDVDKVLELPEAAGQAGPVYGPAPASGPQSAEQHKNKSSLIDPFEVTDDKAYL